MRRTLALVTLVVALASCGQGTKVNPETEPKVVDAPAEPIAGHPIGGVTTDEAELLCNKQYDEIVVPNTPRRTLPLREIYVDGCVDEMTSPGG